MGLSSSFVTWPVHMHTFMNLTLSAACSYRATACSSGFLEELVCLGVVIESCPTQQWPRIKAVPPAPREAEEVIQADSRLASATGGSTNDYQEDSVKHQIAAGLIRNHFQRGQIVIDGTRG